MTDQYFIIGSRQAFDFYFSWENSGQRRLRLSDANWFLVCGYISTISEVHYENFIHVVMFNIFKMFKTNQI